MKAVLLNGKRAPEPRVERKQGIHEQESFSRDRPGKEGVRLHP
jgi:hypothetical protein